MPSVTVTSWRPINYSVFLHRSLWVSAVRGNETVTGATSANVSWAPPDPNLQNGIITYYTVVLADLMFSMPDRVYNTTFTYYVFTGLEEYARYTFQVAAATQSGLGPLSTAVRFTTFEDSEYI